MRAASPRSRPVLSAWSACYVRRPTRPTCRRGRVAKPALFPRRAAGYGACDRTEARTAEPCCARRSPRSIDQPVADHRDLWTAESGALIGVEDLRNAGFPAPPMSIVLDNRHASTRRLAQSMSIQEPALHRDVGDVRAPHLIRSLNRKPPQQIGILRSGLNLYNLSRFDLR